MEDIASVRAPAWLRIVALLGLLWNLIGVYFYLAAVGMVPPPDPAMDPQPMPAWVTGAFAIAVFGGALGSVGLLLLKRWSKLLLLLSLLGVLAEDVWAYGMGNAMEGESPILPILVNLIAILLVWLAYWADKKGWLS